MDKEKFLKELKDLLNRYNTHIVFSVGSCSDTYGLYDEEMLVVHTLPDTWKSETWFSVDGWSLSSDELP